jgi:hypothetical protein
MKKNAAIKRIRRERSLWVKKLEKLHASLRGRGIDVPAEQLIREDRAR